MSIGRKQVWLLAVCLLTIDAGAQSRYRTEVFGSVGAAQAAIIPIFGTSGDSTHLNIGGGFDVRPFSADRSPALRALGGEFEANMTRDSYLSFGTRTLSYFTANLVLHSSLGRTEPYFLFGLGGAHQDNETQRAADIGLGVKIFLSPHISLRPELRGYAAEYLSNIGRVSVALGYHW